MMAFALVAAGVAIDYSFVAGVVLEVLGGRVPEQMRFVVSAAWPAAAVAAAPIGAAFLGTWIVARVRARRRTVYVIGDPWGDESPRKRAARVRETAATTVPLRRAS